MSERGWLESGRVVPRKHLGQNFLLDVGVSQRIVARASWPSCAPVLEIGAGGGSLTGALLRGGHRVTALEVDRTLVALLRSRFAREIDAGLLAVCEGDALEVPWDARDPQTWVAGNLPYGITTPVLLRAFAYRDRLAGAVVMVQREYGERLLAAPGSPAYSSLSVWAAAHAESRKLFLVGRSAFWPRPGVESLVVELRFVDPPPYAGDLPRLERLLRAAFGQRRKTLENALASNLDIAKERARQALESAGCDPRARAETLGLERFAALVDALGEALDVAAADQNAHRGGGHGAGRETEPDAHLAMDPGTDPARDPEVDPAPDPREDRERNPGADRPADRHDGGGP